MPTVLRSGSTSVTLDPSDGGRATSLVVDGLELLGGPGTRRPVDHGLFVMAPYAGRVRDGRLLDPPVALPRDLEPAHALHGFGYGSAWELVDVGPAHAALRCGFHGHWPLAGEVEHRVALHDDRLELELEVRATGPDFPATTGWHPWFRRRLARGEPVAIELPVGALLPRDASGIATLERTPVPPGPWDDCFTDVAWPVVLEWPGALRVEVTADTAYVVVFTERAEAVCVEPQTGPPDGVNSMPRLVTAADPLRARMSLRWG